VIHQLQHASLGRLQDLLSSQLATYTWTFRSAGNCCRPQNIAMPLDMCARKGVSANHWLHALYAAFEQINFILLSSEQTLSGVPVGPRWSGERCDMTSSAWPTGHCGQINAVTALVAQDVM